MVILVSFEKNNLKINLVKNWEMNKRWAENMGEPHNCTWYCHCKVKIPPLMCCIYHSKRLKLAE